VASVTGNVASVRGCAPGKHVPDRLKTRPLVRRPPDSVPLRNRLLARAARNRATTAREWSPDERTVSRGHSAKRFGVLLESLRLAAGGPLARKRIVFGEL